MVDNKERDLRVSVKKNPNDHVSWHALGLQSFLAGDLTFAAQCIEAAIAVNNKVALYHRDVGEIYRRMGELEKAIKAGRRATKLAPTDTDALYNLGLAYSDKKEFSEAIPIFHRALKLNPQHNFSWNNLGTALEQSGDIDAALNAYEKAIEIDPRHAEAQNNAGAIYFEWGRIEDARAAFQKAIEAKPDFMEACCNLIPLKKLTRNDPLLAYLESIYPHRHQQSEESLVRYDFALGKAYDDLGEYDRAFDAYAEGNKVQYSSQPVNENHAEVTFNQIVKVFDKKFFAKRKTWQGMTDDQRRPVFIVGMPRSGTTLLEQILCTHAMVYGAGELKDFSLTVKQAVPFKGVEAFMEGAEVLSEADIKKIGEDYLDRVWKSSPDSRFITDKMPGNFHYLGLIHLALPHAKIIHAMRDPMDSCFSCFSRLFKDSMDFTYDLDALGRYYVRYIKLMRHWHEVLPPGTILDLSYEDMVADTEKQARRVLDFVGLPWDKKCLKFYENDRVVKTASVLQVRKPIYKSSVARWKKYAKHLKPLYNLVKDYRHIDDGYTQEIDIDKAAEDAHIEGIALYRSGRIEQALLKYERSLSLKPDSAAVLNSKGFALQDHDRLDEALECFTRAVKLDPGMLMARFNLGMLQLKLGDWERGWENYELRWTASAEAGAGKFSKPQCPLPQWNGELNTANKRLIVLTEQGFGDTFQMTRYLPLAAKRFAKVGFLASIPTLRLMEWSFSDDVVILSRTPADYETWDMFCPMMSLPRAFGTRMDNVPASMPSLRVPEKLKASWRERLEFSAPGRFRVGVAWSGRKEHQYDKRRSLRFEQLAPLLEDERITWVSLQKMSPQDTPPEIPPKVDWLDWTDELSDFADTAALLMNLDLVISIDSAIVHLAGALNRPVWMMNRFDCEWRWLRRLNDSAWYPSLRIYNQPSFGDWDSVLKNIVKDLKAMPIKSAKVKPKKRRENPQAAVNYLEKPSSSAESMSAIELHQRGISAWQAGQFASAIQLIKQAVSLDRTVAVFHSDLTEMNRQQKHLNEAINHGEQAVKLDPSLVSAHSNLGLAYYDIQNYERAEACHRQALKLAPQWLQSINNLGGIARVRQNLKAAIEWYQKALDINGNYIDALSNIAAVMIEDKQFEAAEPYLMKLLDLQSTHPIGLCNLGLVRLEQMRIDDAVALLKRSLQLASTSKALVALARALDKQGHTNQAIVRLREVVAQEPDQIDGWYQLGRINEKINARTEAEAAYAKALSLNPQFVDALVGLARLHMDGGKFDEALQLLEQALSIDANHIEACFYLTSVRKTRRSDKNFKTLLARLKEIDSMNVGRKITLHYALGKAYDDLKKWDEAYAHFISGARLKRQTLDYDAAIEASYCRRMAALVDDGFIKRCKSAGNRSAVPIFVLGMPCSGTKLVEQIIASHPDVLSAGEPSDLMRLLQRTDQAGNLLPLLDDLSDLVLENPKAVGTDYVACLRKYAPKAKRIIDSMPYNYRVMGLIPLILPNAKIIHVKRNSLDTCISSFSRLFNHQHAATYDLNELGQHYANYAYLMNHWRTVMPAQAFLEVQVEDIISDTDNQIKNLIDWLGLAWDEQCLDLPKNGQAYHFIHSDTVGRWKHYKKFLGPLLEGLGEFAPPC